MDIITLIGNIVFQWTLTFTLSGRVHHFRHPLEPFDSTVRTDCVRREYLQLHHPLYLHWGVR